MCILIHRTYVCLKLAYLSVTTFVNCSITFVNSPEIILSKLLEVFSGNNLFAYKKKDLDAFSNKFYCKWLENPWV